jgi:EAL domain-containing protein (putative c-di-GMP-specific phosphodiesterase class I)
MEPPYWKLGIDSSLGQASPLAVAISESDKATVSLVAEAVATKRLRLAYQPVVQSRDPRRVAFYEGLIRVMEPNGRIIPAKDFIGAVEGLELGREIDCLSLDYGLQALAKNPNIRISVNMSARSIGYSRWMWTLKRGLDLSPTVGERLILEISESSAMLVPELVLSFMDKIQRKGVAFALDDFGASYTVIRYFKDFMFDILKIDEQFVRQIDRDPDNRALTKALLSIGQNFQMFTVAEGVETPEEAECLRTLGVDCQQGFLFGAPTVKPTWQKADVARSA